MPAALERWHRPVRIVAKSFLVGGFKFRGEHPHQAVSCKVVGWQVNGVN
jgi:hypothetical protein